MGQPVPLDAGALPASALPATRRRTWPVRPRFRSSAMPRPGRLAPSTARMAAPETRQGRTGLRSRFRPVRKRGTRRKPRIPAGDRNGTAPAAGCGRFRCQSFDDGRHQALAIGQARRLQDQVDAGGDMLAHGGQRQIQPGHQHHGFQAGQRIARRVRVQRGQRTFVTGIHRREHVERLPPRHSPTTIRSGRMRSALRTSSRMSILPLPSALGGRAPAPPGACSRRSSAASSMVITRSASGISLDSTFNSVVLPDPVPPETIRVAPGSHAERQEGRHGRSTNRHASAHRASGCGRETCGSSGSRPGSRRAG